MTPETFHAGPSLGKLSDVTIIHGDCIDAMAELAADSVDAIVTDPPYGLSNTDTKHVVEALTHWLAGDRSFVPAIKGGGFMGKSWDAFVPPPAVWDECLRVLKPGGHLLSFAGTRTVGLMEISIRLAGFEVRESLAWLSGSGFPKSLSVHKATLKLVESRYDESRCDCLDSRDGSLARDDAGRESWSTARDQGGPSSIQTQTQGNPDIPLHAGAADRSVCELRNGDAASAEGACEVPEAVLLSSVLVSGTEAPRFGHAPVRAGVEEHASQGAAARQGLPVLRDAAGGDCVAHSSSEAIPVRRDEPPVESRELVRFLPPRDRGSNDGDTGSDTDRRQPRRVHLDDQGGRRAPVARVCSWCGLPDQGWLRSLEGLGTATKPAFEPVVVARKPLAGTVAANVLAHGTGALNIDATRIGTEERSTTRSNGEVVSQNSSMSGPNYGRVPGPIVTGRWPANVVLDADQAAALDEQSGYQKDGVAVNRNRGKRIVSTVNYADHDGQDHSYGSGGGASRFFYVAKAPKKERPVVDGVAHPTVKPLALMRWLVRLVTPPGGTVLDPFAGSGTTVEAALLEGFRVVGVEREADYLPMIQQRIARVV